MLILTLGAAAQTEWPILKNSINPTLVRIQIDFETLYLFHRSTIELKNSYIQNIVNSFDKVKSIDSEIRQHKDRNIPREMDKIKEANEKLTEKVKQIVEDRETLVKRIDTIKDEIAKHEVSLYYNILLVLSSYYTKMSYFKICILYIYRKCGVAINLCSFIHT